MKTNLFKKIFLPVLFVLLVNTVANSQMQDRVMIYDDLCYESAAESKDEDSDCLVELVYVRINDKSIISNQNFVADENWLKNLKIRLKNVSDKPFVAVGISFGLIDGLTEELAPSVSWKNAFFFSRGKYSNQLSKSKVSKKVILKPNEEIELTYSDLPDLYKETLANVGEGTFAKSVFIRATVEFENGEQKDSLLFINKNKN